MRVDKKRRKQGKTNYHQRLRLLKGEYLRFVFRKTNKYLILQIIKSIDAQDKVLSSVNSKELLKVQEKVKNARIKSNLDQKMKLIEK